jgi:phosphatidylserine decarboxylase
MKTRRILPFDPDCLHFVLPLALVAVVGWIWGWIWLWAPAGVVGLAVLAFFRDPPRRGPEIPGALWSPADGKVVAIEDNDDPSRGPVPGKMIAIFLSVLDCHVNRSPCAGEVVRIQYERGRFLNAQNPESGRRNENNWILLREGGREIAVRQVAGLIARRIVCRVRPEQRLGRGDRIGLIRFGSRTELYLPAEAEIRVRVGQRVYGARSVLAVLGEGAGAVDEHA